MSVTATTQTACPSLHQTSQGINEAENLEMPSTWKAFGGKKKAVGDLEIGESKMEFEPVDEGPDSVATPTAQSGLHISEPQNVRAAEDSIQKHQEQVHRWMFFLILFMGVSILCIYFGGTLIQR